MGPYFFVGRMQEPLRKPELIEEVALDRGMSPMEVRLILESAFAAIEFALDAGREVHITNFARIKCAPNDPTGRRYRLIRPELKRTAQRPPAA